MNYKIVNIRALAITLIVLGHSMILYSDSWDIMQTAQSSSFFNFLKDCINVVQLEIFFAISGYLFYFSVKKNKSTNSFILNKIKRVILPYYCIMFLWMNPIKYIFHIPGYEYITIKAIIKQMCFTGGLVGHLRFLPTLFAIIVIVKLFFSKIKLNNLYTVFFVYLILCIFSLISPKVTNIFQFYNIMKYSIYFYIGTIINLYEKDICSIFQRISPFLLYLLIIVAFVCSFKIHSIAVVSTSILIIILYYIIPNKTNKFIEAVSKNSFGLYLFHSPLIYITFKFLENFPPFIVVFINFIIGGGIAYLMTNLVRKSRLHFMIGE